jgi:hypothetical protein
MAMTQPQPMVGAMRGLSVFITDLRNGEEIYKFN